VIVLIHTRVVRCAAFQCSTHDLEADNISGGLGILLHTGQPRPLYHTRMNTVVLCLHFTSFRFSCERWDAPCVFVGVRNPDVRRQGT